MQRCPGLRFGFVSANVLSVARRVHGSVWCKRRMGARRFAWGSYRSAGVVLRSFGRDEDCGKFGCARNGSVDASALRFGCAGLVVAVPSLAIRVRRGQRAARTDPEASRVESVGGIGDALHATPVTCSQFRALNFGLSISGPQFRALNFQVLNRSSFISTRCRLLL